jgi:hypothetical protein
MHYMNIIGFNDREQKVAIMETSQFIYWMTYDELKLWMNFGNHIITWFTSMDDFNNITFIK